jgi:hypothetical protein
VTHYCFCVLVPRAPPLSSRSRSRSSATASSPHTIHPHYYPVPPGSAAQQRQTNAYTPRFLFTSAHAPLNLERRCSARRTHLLAHVDSPAGGGQRSVDSVECAGGLKGSQHTSLSARHLSLITHSDVHEQSHLKQIRKAKVCSASQTSHVTRHTSRHTSVP